MGACECLFADDFSLAGETLVFNTSNTSQTRCSLFTPLDDLTVEDTECFYFHMTTGNERDIFNNRDIQVCILDNDGKWRSDVNSNFPAFDSFILLSY